MEISQFTYFQQVGGFDCKPVTGELTYGLERIAMHLQSIDNLYEIQWNEDISYGEIYLQNEQENSKYNFEHILVALSYSKISRTEDIKMLIKNKKYFSELDLYKENHYLLNNIVGAITDWMTKTKIKLEIFELFIDKKVSREWIIEIMNEIINENLEDSIDEVNEFIDDNNLENTAE